MATRFVVLIVIFSCTQKIKRNTEGWGNLPPILAAQDAPQCFFLSSPWTIFVCFGISPEIRLLRNICLSLKIFSRETRGTQPQTKNIYPLTLRSSVVLAICDDDDDDDDNTTRCQNTGRAYRAAWTR
jgi:hypothetical protein